LENIPVGQVTATAVQTFLIPSLSEAEVQDMKTKINAILDTPSEISLGSANVASSYMAVYPEIFVPALQARLRREGQGGSALSDKTNVRQIMNSLHVVEAMAEKNFFGMVLSKQACDMRYSVQFFLFVYPQDCYPAVNGTNHAALDFRRKLEDLVIDLFREEDISIRVTLGQIVASLSNESPILSAYERYPTRKKKNDKTNIILSLSLSLSLAVSCTFRSDPTKIVGIYGPQVHSTNRIVRSRAESVLIECMLSQRRDTSIGDGFTVFIEYIR
jgi:hypothetical protein